MTLRKTKQSSVLLQKAQIDFLRNLARRIEREGHRKMSRSKIIRVLMKTVTCIEPDVAKCGSEREIEKELLKCLKEAVRELKR